MGQSGESTGARVTGQMSVQWDESKRRFRIVNEWNVRGARGEVLELIDRVSSPALEDDEWLERSVTRIARALVAETRAYTEERSAGVQRLL